MEGILQEFLVESYENLDQLDRDLVTLEQDPTDTDTLSSIFRTIHTIKGTCGFLGFSKLESISHVGESLLTRLRDGEFVLNPEITSALLAMVDAIRDVLANIEATSQEGDGDYSSAIEGLERIQQAEGKGATKPEMASGMNLEHQPDHLAPDGKGARHSAVSDSTIRVDVSQLDKLMDLVGELVLARNQIVQFTETQKDSGFLSTTQRLNHVTAELQEGVMKTRMQPIGTLWQKLPRVVRDVAITCGKQANLELEGQDTELDKSVLEAIADPLTHLVRNAVDHGIELPATRVANGKSPQGRLLMHAFHEGGQVNIEISDDGAGIDPELLRQKAVAQGLLTSDQAEAMTDRETLNLIFLPGFSTAERVTNLSGRGVGMDVVKTNVEQIGGTIDIQSVVGQGTTLRVKIPLTLAIIPALIVIGGHERYAIPQVNLLELVRIDTEQGALGVEMIHGTPVYRLRGQLLPLVHLSEELQIGDDHQPGSAVNIVVLQADDRQFGLVVDAIADTQEIVVKPLGKQLKQIPVFAGATILGDGHVALILDVLGLGQRARVVSEIRERSLINEVAVLGGPAQEKETLLLLRIDESGQMAIALSQVARLEEFAHSSVERSNDRDVVQYRGEILPLIDLPALMGTGSAVSENHERRIQVVVHTTPSQRHVGLVVQQILDICETTLDIDTKGRREGIQGSLVVQNRVTDILDVTDLVRRHLPALLEAPDTSMGKQHASATVGV